MIIDRFMLVSYMLVCIDELCIILKKRFSKLVEG